MYIYVYVYIYIYIYSGVASTTILFLCMCVCVCIYIYVYIRMYTWDLLIVFEGVDGVIQSKLQSRCVRAIEFPFFFPPLSSLPGPSQSSLHTCVCVCVCARVCAHMYVRITYTHLSITIRCIYIHVNASHTGTYVCITYKYTSVCVTYTHTYASPVGSNAFLHSKCQKSQKLNKKKITMFYALTPSSEISQTHTHHQPVPTPSSEVSKGLY
jgi:hypothetical protein